MSSGGGNTREEELGLGSGGRCAACKYLRRRCDPGDCALAPYFPASRPRRYADVHAVFGTSNATRLLQSLPAQERARAADTMAAEARWRVQDPVYGSAGIIDRLQQEISAAQRELATTRAELAIRTGMLAAPQPGAQPPPPPPATTNFSPPPSPAAAEVRSGGRLLAGQHREEEEAPVMDTDVLLGLDDL